MDVKAIVQSSVVTADNAALSAARKVGAVSTPAQLSAHASRFIESVSSDVKLSPEERGALTEAVAMIETFVKNPAQRHEFYRDLAGICIYLSESSDKNYPRWSVLTGLRYYSGAGHKLAAAEAVSQDAERVSAIKQKMDSMMEAFRHTSVQDVQAIQKRQPVEQVEQKISQFLGHSVEILNEGVGEDFADAAPTYTKFA